MFDLQHWETFVEIELQGYPHPLPICHPYKVYICIHTLYTTYRYIYIHMYISIFLSTLIFILIPFQGQHTISSGWYIAINIWHYLGISYLKDIIIIHCPYNTIIHDIYVYTFINRSSFVIQSPCAAPVVFVLTQRLAETSAQGHPASTGDGDSNLKLFWLKGYVHQVMISRNYTYITLHYITLHTIPYHTMPYHTIPYHTIHTYTHTCMHACMHACMHIYIHTYIRTYIHTYIQTYRHTDRQTYIDTYIHT